MRIYRITIDVPEDKILSDAAHELFESVERAAGLWVSIYAEFIDDPDYDEDYDEDGDLKPCSVVPCPPMPYDRTADDE